MMLQGGGHGNIVIRECTAFCWFIHKSSTCSSAACMTQDCFGEQKTDSSPTSKNEWF